MALATKVGGFDVLCSNIELDNFDEMESPQNLSPRN